MQTQIITQDIGPAADIIRSGGIVAVPTETVYGLAANGFDEKAVSRIFEVKGRPNDKPLSLMVADKSAMDELCENVPASAYFLADVFWPGPLTIVLPSKDSIPEIVRAGGKTVGLRCPNHPKTLELLCASQLPLAAPSANPSGEKSPTGANEVLNYFNGKIEGIIDGGECTVGKESTIIDMSQLPYRILRAGALSEKDVFTVLTGSMSIIGITGGTGCGKTTALDLIKDMGGLVIDCDEVYHRLLNESEPMIEAISLRFPGAIPEGTHDTKALGEIVFSDPEALKALNQITHKFVSDEITRLLYDWAKNGGEIVAIDAIALIESGTGNICRATVGITAPKDMRIDRLMKREGISSEYAALRIEAQKPNEFFEKNCDYTVSNEGSVAEFENKCKAIFNKILGR